jgi:hypothetical protein
MMRLLRPGRTYGLLYYLPLWRWRYSRAGAWYNFCLYHSRFFSKRACAPYSALCPADKLAVALESWWLYLPRVVASGEVVEYMRLADTRRPENTKYSSMGLNISSRRAWFRSMTAYLRRWAFEHRDLHTDHWTPLRGERQAADRQGTWQ